MQIPTIRNGFEAFECKFEPFKSESKHSNTNSNPSKGMQGIRSEPVFQSVRTQIRTIWKEFNTFESKFEKDSKHSNTNLNHSKGFEAFECKFQEFECQF